jgi:glutamine synthetase
MEALLHEKPFAGINGSGKHNNWSLATDDGINLFYPGKNPESNARFLLFAAAVVEAVDRYALLIRSSVAVSGNDQRLGANEAPPAIVSIFFGGPLTEIFDNIADGKPGGKSLALEMKLGVTSLPNLPKDVSDRNRTSPFAFTGDKFEFRMVGASQSIATANTYLNTALAQVLSEFADKLESLPTGCSAAEKNEAVQEIIKESYGRHRRVVFNGNGYSEEWAREAARRGLPNVKNTVEALAVHIHSDTISLFERFNILTKEEIESRYHIFLEKYSKQINIEAGVTIDLARRYIFPAVSSYAATLASEASSLAAIGAASGPQEWLARKLAETLVELLDDIADLQAVLAEAQTLEDALSKAENFSAKVLPVMDIVRDKVDELEKQVAKAAWPLPCYEELLFKL